MLGTTLTRYHGPPGNILPRGFSLVSGLPVLIRAYTNIQPIRLPPIQRIGHDQINRPIERIDLVRPGFVQSSPQSAPVVPSAVQLLYPRPQACFSNLPHRLKHIVAINSTGSQAPTTTTPIST